MADEYTPTDDDVRQSYVHGETVDGEGVVWDAQVPDAHESFTRWLAAHDARVARDAAREALDGLAENMTRIAAETSDSLTRTSATITARLAGEYKTTVYPEETP